MLKDVLNVPHVSTGDILREAVQAGSSLGRRSAVAGFRTAGAGRADGRAGRQSTGADRRARRVRPRRLPADRSRCGILDRVLGRLGVGAGRRFSADGSGGRDRAAALGPPVCPQCATVIHLDAAPPSRRACASVRLGAGPAAGRTRRRWSGDDSRSTREQTLASRDLSGAKPDGDRRNRGNRLRAQGPNVVSVDWCSNRRPRSRSWIRPTGSSQDSGRVEAVSGRG